MDPKTTESIKIKRYWTLDTIPPEVFLHICSFLSAKFVINILSSVCRSFRDIIENDSTWKMRIFKTWPKQYPLIPDTISNWKEACIEREEQYDLWKNSGQKMKRFHLGDAHFGSVNVVTILQDGCLCASGGRDGALKLWNIKGLKNETDSSKYSSCIIHSKNGAHANAWLWSISYDEQTKHMYSGGFDCHIKSWDLEDPSLALASYCLSSPILCLSYAGGCFCCGCYGRSVNLFDPRRGVRPVLRHIHHKKSVICMATDDKYIISGSEDKKVLIYDKVAAKVLVAIELEAFPLCMSYNSGQLLVGDVQGSFHVIDPSEGQFKRLHSYASGHKEKVTGIQHSVGSIITCSTDKTIRILEPNADPQLIAMLQGEAEISRISAYKTTLASANTDDSISIWLPQEECS